MKQKAFTDREKVDRLMEYVRLCTALGSPILTLAAQAIASEVGEPLDIPDEHDAATCPDGLSEPVEDPFAEAEAG